MSRPRKSRRLSPLYFWQRLVCYTVVVIPPAFLMGRMAYGVLDRLDAILKQSTALAAALASGSLRHEVRIGSLTPLPSVRDLWRDYRHPEKLGAIPIIADDVSIARGRTLAGSGELAYVRRVRLYLFVPALLSGRANAAITRIEVESPRLYLIRHKDGSFNVQELVREEKKPAGPPLLTTVVVSNAAVRFEDRATHFPLPQINDLYPVDATAVIGGRSLHFDVSAVPKAGTVTARRLGGVVTASGSAAQGKPGTRPDASLPGDPQYSVRAAIPSADATYFVRYLFGAIPNVSVKKGRARDATVTLVGPTVGQVSGAQAHIPKTLPPAPFVSFQARLAGGNADINGLPTRISDAGGSVRYVSAGDLLFFDATASAFAAPVALRGSVWHLSRPPAQGGMELSVKFDAPRVPLARVLPAFKANPPKGISLTGVAFASGFVYGRVSDPAATASVGIPVVAVKGVTTLRNLAADLTYGSGTLQASRVTARTDLGGAVAASGRVRFARTPRDGATLRLLPPSEVTTQFTLRADGVPLGNVATLAGLNQNRSKLTLAGSARVAVTGGSRGTHVFLTGDVGTSGLNVSGIPFTVGEARVVLRDNTLLTPFARFESPVVGSLRVSGNSLSVSAANGKAPLALRFTTDALDAGRIAHAFGVPDVGGVVNAEGMVTGTLSSPQLHLARFSIMNPRYKSYDLQSVTGSNLIATKEAIVIAPESPVTARRFPATLRVSGRVQDFLSASPGGKVRPRLALDTRITDLDYSTVQPFLPKPKAGTPGFAGTLTDASAHITGFADAPHVTAQGSLRRILIGEYPVESGEFRLTFADGLITIPSVTVKASVGTVTAKGTITRSGYVYGFFDAPALDLSRVSYLTQKFATLGGILAVGGKFSGTRDRPVITTTIRNSDIVVAGTPLNNLNATNIRYIANLAADVQRIEVPSVSLEQKGGTRLVVEGGSYDFKHKGFAGTVTLRSESAEAFLNSIRQSAFAQTTSGKQAIAGLDALPSPIDAVFPADRTDPLSGKTVATNHLFVSGNASDKGLANYRVRGEIYARGVRAGQYGADSVRIALDKGREVAVPAGQPNIGINIQANKLKIADFVADQFLASGSLVGELATVGRARLISRASTIEASGTAGLGEGGRVNALIDSNSVPLDLIRAFVPGLPLSGSLAVSILATGNTKTPDVRASIEGQNIVVSPPTTTGVKDATTLPSAGAATPVGTVPPPANTVVLSLVRAIARINTDKVGKRFLEISDAQVSREGGGQLQADARIPFSYTAPFIPPTEPLAVHLQFPQQELKAISLPAINAVAVMEPIKKAKKGTKPEELPGFTSGLAEGEIALGGTLREPNLTGLISVKGAAYRFKKAFGRESLNAVSGADATITLTGSRVRVDSTIKLAKPNGGHGDNGSLSLNGDVTISELETLLGALSNSTKVGTEAAPKRNFGAGTSVNMVATFANLEPVENGYFGMKESFRGKMNGKIAVTGTVSEPTIATPRGTPLRLENMRLVPPAQKEQDIVAQIPVDAAPFFDIEIDAPGKNTINAGGIVSVDVSGSARVTGSLGRPSVQGDFLTEGGALQYLLGRFTIDKGGRVTLVYRGNSGYVDFDENDPVTARTTAYLRPGESLQTGTQSRGGPPIASTQPSTEGRGTRYKITTELAGRFAFGASATPSSNTFKISPSSDPPLTPTEIYSLLLPRAQLASAASGDFSRFSQDIANNIINNSVIPGLFTPIEDRLASTFGLEQFSVDYSTSAPITFTLLKRLPDPLERFLITYTRSVQSGGGTRAGGQVPYTAGLLFELYQLRSRPDKPVPRIQFGVFTNEQQDLSGNLRATIAY